MISWKLQNDRFWLMMNEDPLHDLRSRIQLAQDTQKKKYPADQKADRGNMSQGVQAVFDVVATPIVCGGIGIGIDHFLDSSPFFFIILAFLGVCAGFWNLYQASQEDGDPIHSKRLRGTKKRVKRATNSDK